MFLILSWLNLRRSGAATALFLVIPIRRPCVSGTAFSLCARRRNVSIRPASLQRALAPKLAVGGRLPGQNGDEQVISPEELHVDGDEAGGSQHLEYLELAP